LTSVRDVRRIDLPVTECAAQELLALPMYLLLSDEEQETAIEALFDILDGLD